MKFSFKGCHLDGLLDKSTDEPVKLFPSHAHGKEEPKTNRRARTQGHEAEDQGTNKDQPHRKQMKQRENQGRARDELRGGNTRGKQEKTEEERTAGHHTFVIGVIGFMPSSRPGKLPAPSIYNRMSIGQR
ncbi:hypothetical protein POTOM_061758 [Populus tomentosa]|uniref:Uncharacterized protein n=1 Tax=Populus tomentosa TaxID=118781 RepID=A0A8X7XQ61_POPTO|nr:hypothetical protein POTOM_061758 [Populus tomentosa]